MSLFKGTTSFVEFAVFADDFLKEPAILSVIRDKIKAFSFKDIEDSFDQYSIGWVSPLNMFDTDFDPIVGDYVIASIRIDERRVPGATLKKYFSMEVYRQLQEKQIPKLSRSARLEIKERIKTELMRKAKPTSTVFDIIWDLNNNRLLLLSTSKMGQNIVSDIFKETFGVFAEPKATANIKDGAPQDTRGFLTWLWHKSEISPQLLEGSAGVSVHMGKKLLLEYDNDNKVVCVDSYDEAREALIMGKRVVQADLEFVLTDATISLNYAPVSMYYKAVKLPKTASNADDAGDDGFLLEKVYMLFRIVDVMGGLVDAYIEDGKHPDSVDSFNRWVNSRYTEQ